jgi:lipopolysaccharide export system ATP-binding protein
MPSDAPVSSSGDSTGVLRATKLKKSYRRRCVVNEVSIEVHPGEIVGLLEPNGAGKTTTFYLVVGLEEPEEGSVWLGQTEITRLPLYRRARLGISYLPQEPSIFRKLTVEQNILAVLETLQLDASRAKTAARRAA